MNERRPQLWFSDPENQDKFQFSVYNIFIFIHWEDDNYKWKNTGWHSHIKLYFVIHIPTITQSKWCFYWNFFITKYKWQKSFFVFAKTMGTVCVTNVCSKTRFFLFLFCMLACYSWYSTDDGCPARNKGELRGEAGNKCFMSFPPPQLCFQTNPTMIELSLKLKWKTEKCCSQSYTCSVIFFILEKSCLCFSAVAET